MLDSINLNNKSFEQIRDEAVAQIPLYSKDWTNYNASDPGITILENFAAFLALQQGELNEVPDRVKEKLLGLAGFSIRRGSAASIYVSLDHARVKLPCAIPSRAKLYAQDICFETAGRMQVRNIGIDAIQSEALRDDGRVKALLETRGVRGGVALLGNQPAGGEQVLFYVKNLPDNGVKTAIYFELVQRFHRNPLDPGAHNPFATVIWELRTTTEGYSRLEVCDETCGFLQSGYVSFTLGKRLRKSAVKDAAKGMYVLRLTVAEAAYDIVPRFRKVSGLLMHLVQRDTQSDVVPMRILSGNEVCVRHSLLKGGYLELYGRTLQDGLGSKYRKYREGVQYRTESVDLFTRRVIFAEPVPYELIAVIFAESMTVQRKLDMLYGYDNQVIPLPDNVRVYPRAFSVLVVEEADGGGLCHVVRQNAADSREVRYSINEKDNTLVVHDCGLYEGAQLWIGEYAVYRGGGGNVLAGTELLYEQQGDSALLGFVCCTEAEDGCFEEDCAQLQHRFAKDVRTPVTMVTQQDCEHIVRNIPGLSIHKIGVCPVPGRNEIRIAVKPNSMQSRPELSSLYIDEITRYLEQYRMLATKLVIEQPVYVPVNVAGIICVKRHFERCRENIERLLRRILDGISSDKPFGSRVVFHEIYGQLSAQDGVDRIQELSIFPDNYRHANMSGMDIVLDSNALCCPGSFRIELTEAHGNMD